MSILHSSSLSEMVFAFLFQNKNNVSAQFFFFFKSYFLLKKMFGDHVLMCCTYAEIFRDLSCKPQLFLLGEKLSSTEGTSFIVFHSQ